MGVPGDDGEWKAAALVSARPHTSYLKIVDAVGDVPAAVEAVVAHARRQGLAQVKWEGWTATPEQAAAAGFTPLRPPVTREQAGPETGYVRLLHDGAVAEPPTTARPPTSPAAPSPRWWRRPTRECWSRRRSTGGPS